MKFGFLGTTEFATTILQYLITNSNCQPLWVITKPDSISGRGQRLVPPSVKKVAIENNIATHQPDKIDKKFLDNFAHGNPTFIVVVAYGLILPKEFMQLASHSCVNIHTSLLPLWRGAAPIERSIQAGDAEIGISLIKMTEELDAGPIIMQKKCKLSIGETAADLTPRLNEMSKQAIKAYLDNPDAWSPHTQEDDLATYAKKISKEEALIDWSQDASSIARKINAFNPYPGAYSWLKDNRTKLLKAVPYINTNQNTQTIECDAHIPDGSIIYTGASRTHKPQLRVVCGSGEVDILQLQFSGRSSLDITQIQGKSPLDNVTQFSNGTE